MKPHLLLFFTPLMIACAGDLEGDAHWEVKLTGTEDTCHGDNPVGAVETHTYSLFFDASATTLKISGNTFASGTLSGCKLTYESDVTGQDRPEGFVQWRLTGEATIQQGGNSCGITEDPDDGKLYDWYGDETFTIVASDDPSLEVGCTYTMKSRGTFLEL